MITLLYKILNIADLSEEEYRAAYSHMSFPRQQRAARLKKVEDQMRMIAADALARRTAAEITGLPEDSFIISQYESGQPFLIGIDGYLSLSHSGSWAMCAISDHPVGVDIEEISDRGRGLVRRVCTEDEQAYVMRNGHFDPVRFFQVWTAKEASLKLTGQGLSGGLDTTVVADLNGLLDSVNGHQLLCGMHQNAVFSIVY